VPGIWKLKIPTKNEERVLRIQDDGTFYESKDAASRAGLLAGLWDYKESSNTFQLSVESEKEPVLLEGCLEARESSLAANGKIFTGTRLYPRGHPSYFELYQPEETGTFLMQQVLGRFIVMPGEMEEPEPRFHAADFYNKQFWLAATPLPVKKRDSSSPPESSKSMDDIMREEAVDIRLMPIDFFKNNTFAATGSDKILRGRFGVNKHDQVWFQVSLFGAGRSVSGSVYR
jgi:hypothetical protein